MNAIAEECLQAVVLPDLDRGRANWDRPHTELVVMYAKDILAATAELGLDGEILVPAAYGHDWGYVGLFDGQPPSDVETIRAQKAEHMRLGAQKMARLLRRSEFDYLSNDQKLRICELVLVHDEVEMLDKPDELVLMEADTLAAFDGSGTQTLFTAEERARWQENALERRAGRFITHYSKTKLQELVARNAAYD